MPLRLNETRHGIMALAVLTLTVALTGCLGVSLVGEAIRSGQHDIDLVYAPGVSPSELQRVRSFGVSVNGVDASGVVLSAGQGATNTNVYSDMIAQELLRRGFYAGALPEPISESSDAATFQRLRDRGTEVVIIGSMNLSATASVFGGLTGGDWANTGVTAFTIRALDASNGRVLFILSARYGTAKKLNRVMRDFGEAFEGALQGAPSTPPPPPEDAAPPAPTAPTPLLPVLAVTPAASEQPLLNVEPVQRALNAMGYTCGTPDGRLGNRTRGCLRAFQQAEGLTLTGVLDQPTSDAIRRRID